MSLHLILGGADADKTKFCFDMMETLCARGEGSYMIVPDQFSYAAEKTATRRLGGTGLNGVEVLTFNRIVFRVRQKVSLPDYLTAAGREMLVCRAVREVTDEKSVFYGCIDRDGFISVISGLISEFKRYSITPQLVFEQSERASNKALADKLGDIAKIYEKYESFIDGNFSDSDNDLDVAAEYIKSNGTFGGMNVFFDEFSDFLPQNMNVVGEIMKNAAEVYVTLCIPENARVNDDTFDTCRATYSALKRIARENGIECEDIMLSDTKERSAEMRFLLENWNKVGEKFIEPTDNISIFYAKNPHTETEYAASEIIKRVRGGMRFRDIAVLCGSMDTYAHIIESVFREYSIPYFTDETTAVTDHPVITAVTSVFDILENDWKYEDVFRYLRTGFIYEKTEDERVVQSDSIMTDRLENYVLRWGIRGRVQWLSDEKWKRKRSDIFGEGGTDEIDEEIDAFRRRITAPIENFRKKSSGKNAAEKAAALFEFLEEINMPDGIEGDINVLREKGFSDEASKLEQVWELLVEAIEQVYVTMGEQRCSMEDFSRYIRAGLSCCKIRIIPSSLDHVAVGTVERSRNSDAREIFILGANFGLIPADMNKEGILSNRDREEMSQNLAEYNLTVAPDTKKRDIAERYKVYRSLCAAREKLHISYAAAGTDDDALRPSQFVVDIMRMFPKLEKKDDMVMPADTAQTAKSAFRALMLHLDDCGGAWGELRRRFEQDSEYSEKLKHIVSSCRAAAGIEPQRARELFGGRERSVTQFERYESCPYSYFLQYGLRLRERDVWEINGINIGNLCHRIVQRYCETVSEGLNTLEEVHSRWHHLTDEESTRIISEITDREIKKGLEKSVHGKGRLRSVLNRIRRTVYTSVNTINMSLRNGDYTYSASEKPFECELGGARIRGVIDRVDIAEEDGRAYIRIVDYKSGHQSFDLAKIAAGLNLQLVTYAIAARNLYGQRAFSPRQGSFEDVRIGGVLYNKIRDDIEKEENIDKALRERDNSRKMSGMVFADTPQELIYMDSSIKDGAASEFVPIALKKDGNIDSRCCCEPSDMADMIMRHTEKVIEHTEKGILSGEIPARPYRAGDSMPCSYCPYMEVCRFDAKKDSYRSIPTRKEDALSIICGEADI